MSRAKKEPTTHLRVSRNLLNGLRQEFPNISTDGDRIATCFYYYKNVQGTVDKVGGSFMEKRFGRKLITNKKGSVLDLILVGVFCLVFAFAILIGFKITTEINTQIQAHDLIPVEGKTASAQLLGEYTTTMDYGFLFFIVGLSIGVLILAALVRVHPIFIVLYIIGLLIVIFLAGVFSNIYQSMAESADFVALANQLMFIDKIMTFLPWFVAVVGVLLCIVMYKGYQDGMEQ